MKQLKEEAIELLVKLVKTPSISGNEHDTADIIGTYLDEKQIPYERLKNNLVIRNKNFDKGKKTLLLNSHHDTVKPNASWVSDPFGAIQKDGKIIGLGSNDAGASLASLLASFIYFYDGEFGCNLVMMLSAEEENFGPNGIKLLLKQVDLDIELAIVGEPTEMKMAIAEKGLLVIDAVASGVAGHAARPNNHNSIDIAVEDIQKINNYEFREVSDVLGPVVKSVTQIKAGYQHNIIPDECNFVIDVRVNEHYKLEEVFKTLQELCCSKLIARSFNNKPSGIPTGHKIIQIADVMGIESFGSPTLSDQANLTCNSVKIGPGKSTRSHQAEEFILISEIEEGIEIYITLISKLLKQQG